MLRKITIALLLLLFAAGIIYSLYYFRKVKQPPAIAFNAVPTSAALIIETKNTPQIFEQLASTSIIWEELQTTDYFSKLNHQIRFLDSLYSTNKNLRKAIEHEPILISAHMSGANSFNFLFLFSIPPIAEEAFMLNLSRNATGKQTGNSQKVYDGITIQTIAENGISFSVHNGIYMASRQIILVEEAIRQINSGKSILNNPSFAKIRRTKGKNADANIYINHKAAPSLLNTILDAETIEIVNSLSNLADWTALDLKLKPNAVLLNGFTHTNDSLNNYLNVFNNQQTQQISMLKVIPQNTATLVHFGCSDFSTFRKDFKTYLGKNNELIDYGKKILQLNAEFDCNLERNLLSWVEDEMGVVLTEPLFPGEPIRNSYAVFKSNDIETASELLRELVWQVASKYDEQPDSMIFRDYTIRQINIPNLMPTLFGKLFTKVKYNYYTAVDEFIVFGNSFNALRNFVNTYEGEKTLYKNPDFHRFFSKNLYDESNIFIYSNVARSPNIYKLFVNEEFDSTIDKNIELFRKFEAFTIQISKEKDGLFFSNLYLHYNPVYKQESSSLWEVLLDTSFSMKPKLLLNHYTKAKEVFMQDDGHQSYLISPTGRILWKKELGEKIISDIYQIDAFGNKKLQMVFNTANKLWLVDRKGRDVEGFPIELKAPASGGLSVLDYDKKKEYRILVPCSDNVIYNYDKEGKLVRGWRFKSTEAPVKLPIQHFNMNKKDYIIAIDSIGNVYALDRRGKKRLKIKEQLHVSPNNSYYIETRKDIKSSCLLTTDSTGNIVRLYFNGKTDTTHIDDFSTNHFFNYQDIDHDGSNDYIFVDGDKFAAYSQDNLIIFESYFDAAIAHPPLFFDFGEKEKELGITSIETNEIYLLNGNGEIHEGLPLYGSTLFSIADINKDGIFNIVVGGKDNRIYTYTLE